MNSVVHLMHISLLRVAAKCFSADTRAQQWLLVVQSHAVCMAGTHLLIWGRTLRSQHEDQAVSGSVYWGRSFTTLQTLDSGPGLQLCAGEPGGTRARLPWE